VATSAPDAHELTERLLVHLRRRDSAESITSLQGLPGGLSGITYLVSTQSSEGPRRLVVKVAPAGVEPTKNRDVLRQARILEFLGGRADIPVPRLLFTDPGRPPAIPPFYATDFVDGVSCEPLDEDDSPVPADDILRRRYLHAAAVLGRLHRVPVEGLELAQSSFTGPADELDRWTRAFRSVPAELSNGAEICASLLSRDIPASGSSALVHGDYRLGNTICTEDRVAAVIDWELWDVGDPRTDLAWLLHLSDPAAKTTRRHLTGVPSRAQIIAAYGDAAGYEVTRMRWFDALALYKRAAATALIVKYNRRSPRPDPRKEQAVRVIEPLLAAAEQALTEPE
jgi:aminoglycoside phosphotransferase (APT) family kinase protein